METVMEDDNLLEEILLHLPAETVHGCKPVSKRWCNLISSLRFRRCHATYHLPDNSSSSKILMINQEYGSAATLLDISNGITVIKPSKIDTTKLLSSIQPFYEKFQKEAKKSEKIEFGVHDTYNGLFLFSLRIKREKKSWSFDFADRDYLVCNPLTKEYHQLPITPEHKLSRFPELAFAPSKPYYKVILVFKEETGYIVKIYCSETRTWKDFGNVSNHCLYESKSMVWDNCLLVAFQGIWWSKNVCALDSEKLHVLYSSSLLPKIITLEKPRTSYMIVYMGESGGVLYVIVREKTWDSYRDTKYMLWEMKGVDGDWTEKFQFKIEEEDSIVYIHKEGEHVRLLLWLSSTATIYHCLNGNTENLQEAGALPDIHGRWGIKLNFRSYTPTLVPLGR